MLYCPIRVLRQVALLFVAAAQGAPPANLTAELGRFRASKSSLPLPLRGCKWATYGLFWAFPDGHVLTGPPPNVPPPHPPVAASACSCPLYSQQPHVGGQHHTQEGTAPFLRGQPPAHSPGRGLLGPLRDLSTAVRALGRVLPGVASLAAPNCPTPNPGRLPGHVLPAGVLPCTLPSLLDLSPWQRPTAPNKARVSGRVLTHPATWSFRAKAGKGR